MTFSGQSIYSALQLVLAPMVLISACALLCLVFYNRLTAMVSRIRMYNKDFSLIDKDDLKQQAIVRQQIELIFTRAKLIRMTIGFLITTIIMMLLTSISLGIANYKASLFFYHIGLVFFFGGIVSMLMAMSVAMLELFKALAPVRFEYLKLQ